MPPIGFSSRTNENGTIDVCGCYVLRLPGILFGKETFWGSNPFFDKWQSQSQAELVVWIDGLDLDFEPLVLVGK